MKYEPPPLTLEDHMRKRIRLLEYENYWLRIQVWKERITNNPKFDYRGCP